MPRPRPRTVALPLAATLLALAGLAGVLTHPDEAITVSIASTSSTTNPPGSFGPRTFKVTGTAHFGVAVYKKFRSISVLLVRKDEETGADRPLSTSHVNMRTSSSFESLRDDGRSEFTLIATPKSSIDEDNLFLRVMPSDVAGRQQGVVDVPVRRD